MASSEQQKREHDHDLSGLGHTHRHRVYLDYQGIEVQVVGTVEEAKRVRDALGLAKMVEDPGRDPVGS